MPKSWDDALVAFGQPQEALTHYADALKLSPALWSAHVGRARALLALGRVDEAVREFEITAKGNPDNPMLYREWEKALDALGRRDVRK